MAITITCTCGKQLQLPESAAGKKGKCPACGNVFPIPAVETAVSALPVVVKAAPPKPPPLPAAYDLPPPEVAPRPREEEDDDAPLRSHANVEITEDDDFFADAPPEIGHVLSAHTGLRAGKEPMNPAMRYAIGAAIALFFAFAAVALLVLRAPPLAALGVFAVGALIGVLTVFFTRFSYTCNYVGRNGVAEFTCSGSRDNLSKETVFLFQDAAELRTAQTRHYYNGVYTGTNYTFTWSDEDGRHVHALSGNYKSQEGNPEPNSPFHFAIAAEIAWTEFLFRNIDALMADGKLLFGLKGKDFVRLSEGRLVLNQGGKKTVLDQQDIAAIQIDQGVVAIREVGAKEGWFSSTGIHRFAYADLGNARFFLFAVEKVVGVRFAG